jgi:hypothetical protein
MDGCTYIRLSLISLLLGSLSLTLLAVWRENEWVVGVGKVTPNSRRIRIGMDGCTYIRLSLISLLLGSLSLTLLAVWRENEWVVGVGKVTPKLR